MGPSKSPTIRVAKAPEIFLDTKVLKLLNKMHFNVYTKNVKCLTIYLTNYLTKKGVL